RVPDVSFIAWDQLPKPERPTTPVVEKSPALAVEVLSPTNTKGEIQRKLKEYFLGGTRAVWVGDLEARTVNAYSAPDRSEALTEADTLDGGEVLPVFPLPLAKLFAPIPRVAKPKRKRKSP